MFGVLKGKSVLFRFNKLHVCKYSEVSGRRVGRLLRPHVTRVQQRYAMYMQRQTLPCIPGAALPRIPKAEVPPNLIDAAGESQ